MSFKYLDNYKFTPFSHRGGAIENDENTIEAFDKSISLGYEYIETDVQQTKDNKLVIFHDDDLKRILNLDIKISEINFKELSEIKLFNKHRIPLLSEALNTWPNINFNIEPKSESSAQLLLEVLKNEKNLDRFCIGSFKSSNLDIIRKGLGNRVCSSMSKQEVIELFINRIIYPFNNVHAPCLQIPMYFYGVRIVTEDLVNYIHSLEKKIHVWTINDENEINSLIDWNVDGIMTDRPAKLKEILIKKLLWPH